MIEGDSVIIAKDKDRVVRKVGTIASEKHVAGGVGLKRQCENEKLVSAERKDMLKKRRQRFTLSHAVFFTGSVMIGIVVMIAYLIQRFAQ